MRHKKTTTAILFSLLSLSLAVSGSASWIIMSPTVNVPVNKEDAVCYIEETGEYFSSVEGAIYEANLDNAARKVIVIPGVTTTIENSIALNSGVDLLLPYNTKRISSDGGKTIDETAEPRMTEISKGSDGLYITKHIYNVGNNAENEPNYPEPGSTFAATAEYDTYVSNNFSDSTTTNINNYLNSTIIISKGKTLTINNGAQLVIYGQLGTPAAWGLSGATCGYYSQIILMDNAKIINNGIIDCRGYIKEGFSTKPTENDKSLISNNSYVDNYGTLYLPFVIYDYSGATPTIGAYTKSAECPFNMYDMPNIHSKLRTYNGAKIIGRGDLSTGYESALSLTVYFQHNTCFIDIFSNNSGSMIQYSNVNVTSKILETKFHPYDYYKVNNDLYVGLTNNRRTIGKKQNNYINGATTTLNIYDCTIDMNYLTLNISVFGKTIPITTNGNTYHNNKAIFFPIPWQYNINVFRTDANINSDVKMMPGSVININDNSTLNINKNFIIYTDKYNYSGDGYGNSYPKGTNKQDAAILNLKQSEMIVNSSAKFGGKVSTAGDSILTISTSNLNNSSTTSYSEFSTSELAGALANPGAALAVLQFLGIFGSRDFDSEVLTGIASLCTDPTNTYTESCNATADIGNESSHPETNLELGFKYTSGTDKTYFDDIRLINDKVLEVTLSTSSGNTESIMSDFNDQVVATINPSLATQYTVVWVLDNSNAPGATLTKTDNPLIRNICIHECSIDNGSYSVNVTINITNTLDGSVVSNSITLYSHGPLTTARLVNENGDVNPKLVKNDGGRSDQDPDIHKLNLEITSDLLGPDDEILEIFDITWTINEGNDKITSGASWKNTVYFNGNDTSQKLENVTYAEVYLRPSDDADGTINVDLYKKGTSTVVTSVNIEYDVYGGCFEAGTIVNTKDGNKPVEDLISDDLILSYNHYTGQYEYQPIFAVVNHGESLYDVVELYFDDGSYIGLIATHGLYDLTLNKYVEITQSNYKEYVNHKFAKYNENGDTDEVVLVSCSIVEKLTSSYTVITANNYNCVANGLLNVTSMLHGFYNIFDYIDNMMYNPLQVQTAIAAYGLFAYEEWSDYVSYEIFTAINGPYFKLAVGNGSITYSEIYHVIEWYYSLIESGEIIISPYLQMSSN